MTFPWMQFLEQYRVEYVTSGKNTSKGHVSIRCPFCGLDDPSHHMSINLDGLGWACWRNRQHKGRSPVKLIQALIHCSVADAKVIAGERNSIVPENLAEMVQNMLRGENTVNQSMEMPAEFKPFRGQYTSKRFSQYLHSRGFPTPAIEGLTKEHDIFYAVTGAFFGRVLFMVRSPEGDLKAWSGRSIFPSEKLRYKTEGPIGDYLLRLDHLYKAPQRDLVLCEGPMDALKVSVLGKTSGVAATCCFTSAPTKRQIDYLYQLRPLYRNIYVMLDHGEVANILWTTAALAPLQIKPVWLPPALKDPGEIRSQDQLMTIMGLAEAGKMS